MKAMEADSPSAIPRAMGCYVGVDVVDLTADRLRERGLSRRFVERVFSESERARIESASDRLVETWSLWAAKEAGFKVVSKLLGAPPVFEHRAFEVRDAPGQLITSLRYRDVQLDLTVRAEGNQVVVHAWNDPSSLVMVSQMQMDAAREALGFEEPFGDWCEDRFSAEERDALHSRASAFVRLLARRDAAHFLNLGEDRLSIRCRPGPTGQRPPYLYLDGQEMSAADLSFSHHGTCLAWALIVPWTAPGP